MLQENIAFHYWIYLCAFLFFKMFTNSMIQGYARFRGNFFLNPEDTEQFADTDKEIIQKLKNLDERVARCWRNDLENIPFFLILGLGMVLLGIEAKHCLIYFSVFAFLRTSHTIFYLAAKQPYRGIAFGFGVITTISAIVHCVYITFTY